MSRGEKKTDLGNEVVVALHAFRNIKDEAKCKRYLNRARNISIIQKKNIHTQT